MIQWLRRWMRAWFFSPKPQEDDDRGAVVCGVGRSDEGYSSGSAASQNSEPEERASAADAGREAESHSTVLSKEVASSDKGKSSEPPSGPDETDPPAPDEVVVFDGDGSDVDDVPDERTDARDASPVDESDEQVVAEGSAASRDVELDERGPVADAVSADSSEEASTSEAVKESDRLGVVLEADPTTSNEVTEVPAEDDGSGEGDSPSVDEPDEPGVAEALVVSRSVASNGRKPAADAGDKADSDSAGTQEVPSPEAVEESDKTARVSGTEQRLTDQQSYPHRRVAPPRRIGGRRHPADSSRERPGERRFTPRPELICREAGWSASWQAVIAIPDEISGAVVHQDGDRLEETGGEFVLPRFVGKVTVTGEDGVHHDLPLEPPLIFKFPQDWRGVGRKVRGITKGHYIVMVPREQDWCSDDAPVEPAPCQDDKFMAHFVYHEGDTESAPRGLDPGVSGLLAHSFTLEGASVHDDSDQGVLYVGDPPRLKCDESIVWVLIGQEGRSGWVSPAFNPNDQSLGEVLGGQQGHMFIRVYDENTDLRDSAEFRYHRRLRGIRVNDQPYTGDTVIAPSATGHSEATIEFVAIDGGSLRPSADPENSVVSIVESKVIVRAVPVPDRFSLRLASDGGETPCVIVLPRIWWRLEAGGQGPGDWSDQPLRMTRDQFRDHADAETILLLRLPGSVTSLSAGFDEGHRNRYRRSRSDERTEIPLADFAEYTQIEERLEKDALLTAQWKDGDFTLIRITADPAPVIRPAFSTKPGTGNVQPHSPPTTWQAPQAPILMVTEDWTATQLRYRLITTHHPELTEAENREQVLKLVAYLAREGAADPRPYCWYKRRPANMIDYVPEGHYYTEYYFTAEPAVVRALQRVLSLAEDVMHYKLMPLT